MEVVPAGGDIGGNGDFRQIRDLVFPVAVHKGVVDRHLADVFDEPASHKHLREKGCETLLPEPTPEKALTVNIDRSFPRSNAGQMGGLLCRYPPLTHRECRAAEETDLAVAPLPRCQPLDRVIAVAAVLRTKHLDVALGVAHAAGIIVHDGVALVAPILRVWALELGVVRVRPIRYAGRLPGDLQVISARALSVEAPGDDNGHVRLALGSVDVAVGDHPVTHGHCHILLADDSGCNLVDPLVQSRMSTKTVRCSRRARGPFRRPWPRLKATSGR